MRTNLRLRPFLGVLAAALALHGVATAQYNERPFLPGSGQKAVDCSGRSIKNQRVRAIHEEDPSLPGGTAYFFAYDPFLAYQLGRNLNFREFRERDGTFDARVSNLKGPMPDGTTAKITANNQTSCLGCHNLPQGNPGGGPNFSKDSGRGRNSPHYYGAGIVEMLAIQIRSELLRQIDTDGDGHVDVQEALAAPPQVFASTAPGGPQLDFGSPRLSGGSTGKPAFDNIVRVWYLDQSGKVVPGATQVDGVKTFGYDFEIVVWGFGQGPGRSALNPTNRVFLWDPYATHAGLESYDPTTTNDPDGDGVSLPSQCGAIQFPATHLPPDHGNTLDPLGFSRDDPDGDGHLNEISEGDLDLAEWFMLNAPRPAFAGTEVQFAKGVREMRAMGCVACHVPTWRIRPKDDTFAGDRRFFDLNVVWNPKLQRLEGHVVPLYDRVGDRYERRFGAFTEYGLFSDLRQHDMGKGFEEVDFGGNVNTLWRTTPLWGVGSSAPYGHDGHALTLQEAILRHDGEGAASKAAWLAASQKDRDELLDFLRRLVLYDIESLPTDVDGDHQISDDFVVAGVDTGYERFDAEWLFRVPVRIQGPFVNSDGVTVLSAAATNVEEAYGEQLMLRVDSDHDGWPDVWDRAPFQTGYEDGVN